MGSSVVVEEVVGTKDLRRFGELPTVLHGDDPRFAWPVIAWERYRLDPRRNPFFEGGDGAYFLARKLGRPAGRITAHVAGPAAEPHFGFWSVADDFAVARALLDAASAWLAARGHTSMVGPLSFTGEDDFGVLASGFDVPGLTGRSWSPPHESAALTTAGLMPHGERPTWRLSAVGTGARRPLSTDQPGQAGRHGDPRIVLEGVAAVPDVSGALRRVSPTGAWRLLRRARRRDWDTCTMVRCAGTLDASVRALQTAAAEAGYRDVIAPWTPDPRESPETVHRTYRLTW